MVRRTVQGGILAAVAIALLGASTSSAADGAQTRYSFAGGCFALSSSPPVNEPGAGAQQIRMQATGLGSYLLFTQDQKFLTAQGDGTVTPTDTPSPAGDWTVTDGDGPVFFLSPKSDPNLRLNIGQGGALSTSQAGVPIVFEEAQGCATYPEADLNATGKPKKGKTSYGPVGGYLEGHNHWMNFEYLGGDFHCGRPFDRYGIPYALPDCSYIEGPQGTAAPVQNTLNFGNPAQAHDTTGWPKFTEWGAHNLTYDGVYWRWIERAYLSGLRMMVMPVNENRVLCELIPQKRNPCNEDATAELEFDDMRRLQDYVDAQAGGPGKGFFQIVTDPYEARRVINEGRMAVVLEIEISEPFGCRGWETSTCDKAMIDKALDKYYDLGVRSSLLLNKFDNPLVGVRFDSGPLGILINAGNRSSAGSFWSAETCKGPEHDNEIETVVPEGNAFFDSLLAGVGVTSGEIPAYPPAPHCNTRGLTELGRFVVKEMMKKHMIVNPDHMSQAGVDDTLTLLEAHDYSGVISPHGWVDPGNWPRYWKLGGLAFPDSATAPEYLDAYETYRPKKTPYMLGWGYGADLGGLAAQPDAPGENGAQVTYPFKSYDGSVTFDRQTTGERTFDYNEDGVAHYGLYPEWFEEVQNLGGKKMAKDMWNGAEAYLEMWERAEGIKTPGCKPTSGHVNSKGLGRLELGAKWEKLLKRAGQPQQRDRAWSYCVRGKKNGSAADVAELSKKGKVELITSTAKGRAANDIAVGAPVDRLDGADRAGGGVYTEKAGGARYVFATHRGKVRAVGVATGKLAKDKKDLRGALSRAITAVATNAKPKFVPNSSAASGRITGTNLAGSSDPRLNQALRMLCQLNR